MITGLFDLNHCIAYAAVAVLVMVTFLLYDSRRRLLRLRKSAHDRARHFRRLDLVLKTGRLRIWEYTPANRHYYYLTETGSKGREYNPVEFSQLFNRDDFEDMRSAVFDLCEHKRSEATVALRSHSATELECRYYEVNVSVAERDRAGNIVKLMGIEHDTTDDIRKQHTVNKLLMRYHTVFNSSLVDMVYYDANGVLRDLNERACKTFGVKDRQMVLDGHFMLQNNPFFNGVELEKMDNIQSSSIVDFEQYQDKVYRIDEFGLRGRMYYESTINPIRDSQGRLEGIFMAGREVTEMVESYHQLQDGMERLRKATDDVQRYVSNINYALRVTGVRLVDYYPRQYTLELSDNISHRRMRLSQLRCIRLATPRFRRTVSSVLNRMDHLTRHNITETIETELRDEKGRQVWLQFNLVPMLNPEGGVERYFGMIRNMTDLVETERRLAVETKKAQETELLKQAFLTNMSYEIRTPLNTVVGYAELFEQEHDPADEAFFVDEIKKSSNKLLMLINDVLFLSRIDANMIEFNKADVDFALTFEGHCQIGCSTIKPQVRLNVENPYQSLVVCIDEEHVGKVIEKVCSLATTYTTEGSITAWYEYRRGELTITIEDTGVGMSPEAQQHIFDRFVRNERQELCGTGLDLPIAQAMVQQMGGIIDIESQEGHGTTVWISIPCEASHVDRRREVTLNHIEPLT